MVMVMVALVRGRQEQGAFTGTVISVQMTGDAGFDLGWMSGVVRVKIILHREPRGPTDVLGDRYEGMRKINKLLPMPFKNVGKNWRRLVFWRERGKFYTWQA